MPPEQIRPATESDITALAKLYHEFHEFHVQGVPDYLHTLGQWEGFDTAVLAEALQRLLADEQAAVLVLEQAGRLLGFVEVYLHHTDPENTAVVPYTYGLVQSLMVTETARGQARGRALLTAAEQWVQAHNGREIQLNSWEFAAGPLHFYEHLGYHTLKRTLVRRLEE